MQLEYGVHKSDTVLYSVQSDLHNLLGMSLICTTQTHAKTTIADTGNENMWF